MAKAKYADLPQYYGEAKTEGAANGGVIAQIPSSLTTRDKVGILIHSIEFLPEGYKTVAPPFISGAAAADGVVVGITQLYNAGAVPAYNAPGVLDWNIKVVQDLTSVGIIDYAFAPWKFVFGTPKLAHPASIYWFFSGVSQPAALTMNFRMEYSYRDLSDSEYQDIIQTIVLQNAL